MSSLLKTLIPFKLHPANVPNPPEAALGCSGQSWVSQVSNMQQEKVSVFNKIIKLRVQSNTELLRSSLCSLLRRDQRVSQEGMEPPTTAGIL